MPGLTNNTTLLAAANQIIVALNEISSQIVLGDLSDRLAPDGQSIYAALGDVGDQVEAQTIALGTDFGNLVTSTDAISTKLTAIDTDLGSLVTSTDAISTQLTATNEGLADINSSIATCCVNLQTKLGEIVTAIGNIRFPSLGGGTGVDVGGPYSDEPEITPPVDPPVDVTACKGAYFVYDYMMGFLDMLNGASSSGLDWHENVAIPTLVVVLGAIPLVGIPAATIIGIINIILSMLLSLESWKVMTYFGELKRLLEEQKQDIICDLYNAIKSNSPTAVKNVFYTYTTGAVSQVVELVVTGLPSPLPDYARNLLINGLPAIVSAVMGNYLVNKVFDEGDTEIEAYEASGDCDTCGQTPVEGAVLQTSTSYPYNVLIIGDSTPTGGEPSTGWYIPAGDRKYFYFTPSVEVLTIKVTAEIKSGADPSWTVGTIELSSVAYSVKGTAGVWTEIEYTGTCSPSLPANTQTAMSMMGMGGNDFYIRNLLVIANPVEE